MKVKALSGYASNEKIEDEGVWFPLAPEVEWKIRRMRSKHVERAKEKIYGPHERAMNGKKLPETLELELTKRLLSQAVVIGWRGKGMTDDNGEEIPFSADNCYSILSDEETGRDLRTTVIAASMDGELFTKEDEGN